MSIAKKLTTVAQNMDKVYQSGYTSGYETGKAEGGDTETAYNEGFTDGKQAEYDRFWDAYQQQGNRTDYTQAFVRAWTDEIFRPKYHIKPTNMSGMFQYSAITDLKDKLETLGVTLDTSNCTSLIQAFQYAEITHIPTIDARLSTNMAYTFGSGCKVVAIDKLIVSETTPIVDSTFGTARDLQNITFEGTIGRSINLQWSPLTKESMKSVVAALSGTATGLTASFKKTAAEAAFTEDEWNALVATKSNWTFTKV